MQKLTPDNLAVITMSNYGKTTENQLHHLLASCRKFGIELNVMEFETDHYRNDIHKISHRLEFIRRLDARYQYILFVDGRDAFFTQGLDHICEQYNRHYPGELVIGGERISWPCDKPEWTGQFPKLLGDRSYINSGVFIGPRESIEHALETFVFLREHRSRMPLIQDVLYVFDGDELRSSSEQVYWQLAQIKGLIRIRVDAECRIVANISAEDDMVIGPENRDYIFKGKTLTVKSSSASPAIIHVPGAWHQAILERWQNHFVKNQDFYSFTPFDERGISYAYNDSCRIVPNPEDLIVLQDGDIMLLPGNWGKHLLTAMERHPEYDAYVCMATRTWKKDFPGDQQLLEPEGVRDERDLIKLFEIVNDLQKRKFAEVIPWPPTRPPSGFFFAFRKKLWDEYPFARIGWQGSPYLGIDTDWFGRLMRDGKKIGLLTGLAAIHFYRFNDPGEAPENGCQRSDDE